MTIIHKTHTHILSVCNGKIHIRINIPKVPPIQDQCLTRNIISVTVSQVSIIYRKWKINVSWKFSREKKMTSQLRQTPLTCSGHTRPVVFLDFSDITPFGYFLISACKGIPAHFSIAYAELSINLQWPRFIINII